MVILTATCAGDIERALNAYYTLWGVTGDIFVTGILGNRDGRRVEVENAKVVRFVYSERYNFAEQVEVQDFIGFPDGDIVVTIVPVLRPYRKGG
jgi:hypothetical protein